MLVTFHSRIDDVVEIGGPKPGGVAMAEFPKLGLDAFCQKLVVYEDRNGKATVIFNDIVELAKLPYGGSAKPHEIFNGRLTGTFRLAVQKQQERPLLSPRPAELAIQAEDPL